MPWCYPFRNHSEERTLHVSEGKLSLQSHPVRGLGSASVSHALHMLVLLQTWCAARLLQTSAIQADDLARPSVDLSVENVCGCPPLLRDMWVWHVFGVSGLLHRQTRLC